MKSQSLKNVIFAAVAAPVVGLALCASSAFAAPAPLTVEQIKRQEQLLQFDKFTNDMAFEIGVKVIENAKANKQRVAVNITRNGQTLFFHGMEGMSKEHDEWIRRKSNLVNRTGKSSFQTHTEVVSKGGNIDAIPTFSLENFAAHGGSFPIVIKGTGPIGTITVTGLPGPDDHELVTTTLQQYLKVKTDW